MPGPAPAAPPDGAVVFDMDKVLLGGDASTLFLRGRLRQSRGRTLALLLAAPLLLPGAAVPQLRPLTARVMTRLAVGGSPDTDVDDIAEAYRSALQVKPEAAIADAIACVRKHQAAGQRVVVATGCEETLAGATSPRSASATSRSSARSARTDRRGCAGPWARARSRC